MNKDLMKKLGFSKEVEAIEKGLCPFCKQPIDKKDFRDDKSRKEHEISGLCQGCQDEIFK